MCKDKNCERIKNCLTSFVAEELKMELSEDKTIITHSNEYARFLNYDIRVRRDNRSKRPKQEKKFER